MKHKLRECGADLENLLQRHKRTRRRVVHLSIACFLASVISILAAVAISYAGNSPIAGGLVLFSVIAAPCGLALAMIRLTITSTLWQSNLGESPVFVGRRIPLAAFE
jgi:hypothetical protein